VKLHEQLMIMNPTTNSNF